ncbi:TonB system transport protein ExbD [Gemmobacter denitrificans]|uniref:Biopolymer transport protein ExbD n=1 Tax=Gemmobacter denitrificans TaxID=3123040 RepID=A0ABU8BSX8_9RHOB
MAASLRPENDDDLAEAHEINVTPFIDVMLVLLIIFMVAAPLSTVDVPVTLPGSNASPQERPEYPVFLTLAADLTVSVGTAPVSREGLAAALNAATGGNPDTRIFLRADQAVAYGELMAVMNLLRDGGFRQVALVGAEEAP